MENLRIRKRYFVVILLLCLLAGSVFVNAQVSYITACVNSVNGNVRIVDSTNECREGEVIMFWDIMGQDGADGFSVLVNVTEIPADENCPAGGLRMAIGLDNGANGATAYDSILSTSEIQFVHYICQGEQGIPGDDGFSTLIRLTDEEAGDNCAYGGQQIDAGSDDGFGAGIAYNGVLEADEIRVTRYVCNGAPGADGAQGPQGEPGDDGTDGVDGNDGFSTLINLSDEPAGANCEYGGQRVNAGLDTDSSGVLDGGEITVTNYVCNGEPGTSGTAAEGSEYFWCWDLNQNHASDAYEDINADGLVDDSDCVQRDTQLTRTFSSSIAPLGLEVVTTRSTGHTLDVFCPNPDDVVVGGGVRIVAASLNPDPVNSVPSVSASHPVTNSQDIFGWRGTGHVPPDYVLEVTAHCIDSAAVVGYEIIMSGDWTRCNLSPYKHILGGGASYSQAAAPFISYPFFLRVPTTDITQQSWKAESAQAAWAICAEALFGQYGGIVLEQVETEYQDSGDGGEVTVEARCQPGQVALSGGAAPFSSQEPRDSNKKPMGPIRESRMALTGDGWIVSMSDGSFRVIALCAALPR